MPDLQYKQVVLVGVLVIYAAVYAGFKLLQSYEPGVRHSMQRVA